MERAFRSEIGDHLGEIGKIFLALLLGVAQVSTIFFVLLWLEAVIRQLPHLIEIQESLARISVAYQRSRRALYFLVLLSDRHVE